MFKKGKSEDPRPWNLIKKIRKYTKKNHILLDIGSGNALKLTQLANNVKKTYGLELKQPRIKKAKQNIHGFKNIELVQGYAELLPFENNTFDTITCMVAPHNTLEVYHVLKPNGFAILEKVSEKDHQNIKTAFGYDKQGFRGSIVDCYEDIEIYKRDFEKLFSEVSISDGSWKTYYTKEGLLSMLEESPMIRGFDRNKDADIVKKIEEKYSTKQGIETLQHRVLIIAKK